MSGVGFFELVILFMIGLVVLGPKRLPKVASQLGSWVGQARRMTRAMKRQLEEELNVSDEFDDIRNIGEDLKKDLSIDPSTMHVPRDDDTYSPIHDGPETPSVGASFKVDETSAEDAGESGDAVAADTEEDPANDTAEEKQA